MNSTIHLTTLVFLIKLPSFLKQIFHIYHFIFIIRRNFCVHKCTDIGVLFLYKKKPLLQGFLHHDQCYLLLYSFLQFFDFSIIIYIIFFLQVHFKQIYDFFRYRQFIRCFRKNSFSMLHILCCLRKFIYSVII